MCTIRKGGTKPKTIGVKLWPFALRIGGHKSKPQDQDTNDPHAGPVIHYLPVLSLVLV